MTFEEFSDFWWRRKRHERAIAEWERAEFSIHSYIANLKENENGKPERQEGTQNRRESLGLQEICASYQPREERALAIEAAREVSRGELDCLATENERKVRILTSSAQSPSQDRPPCAGMGAGTPRNSSSLQPTMNVTPDMAFEAQIKNDRRR